MRKVDQSKLYCLDGIHNGNCYAACLATLLDIPLWMVPPFEDMFGRAGEWRSRTNEWLGRFFGSRLVRTQDHHPDKLPPFYIANGRSERGIYHSVIYSEGKLAHDPHPSRAGIKEVEWCWHIAPGGEGASTFGGDI